MGRDDELGRIAAAVGAGGAGVVIAGAAGTGKTRLATEAAERSGRTAEWVRATRSAAAIPLGAFAGLLPAAGPGRVAAGAISGSGR